MLEFTLWERRVQNILKCGGVLQRKSKRSKKAKDFGSKFCSFLVEDDPNSPVRKQYCGSTYKKIGALTST